MTSVNIIATESREVKYTCWDDPVPAVNEQNIGVEITNDLLAFLGKDMLFEIVYGQATLTCKIAEINIAGHVSFISNGG